MVRRVAWLALLSVACNDEPRDPAGDLGIPPLLRMDVGGPHLDAAPIDEDEEPAVLAETPPPPVSGGTLLVSRDGTRIFAADPDRDVVYVVDIADPAEATRLHEVSLAPGAEPGRLAESAEGLVHVALRRGGQVVTLDPDTGELVSSRDACANPRGLAVDPVDASIVVACAEGVVVRLGPDDAVERLEVGEELRDVVDVGPPLRVSTFRNPRVLTLDESGAIIEALGPWPLGVRNARFVERSGPEGIVDAEDGLEDLLVPNTARHTVATHDGGWFMLHQAASTQPLSAVDPEGYGSDEDCIPLQAAVLSYLTPGAAAPRSLGLHDLAPAFDAAVTDDGGLAAVVGGMMSSWRIGFFDGGRFPISRTVLNSCGNDGWKRLDGEPTSVVFDGERRAWVLLREPARLVAFDPASLDQIAEVELSATSVFDTGHAMFHQATRFLVACVSCHPEGREDGLTWEFEELGRLRTQPIDVGLEDTAPLHWRGDLADFSTLHDEVRVHRMGGDEVGNDHVAALQRWVFSLRPLEVTDTATADEIERGRALFEERGCVSCHLGPKLTNNVSEPIPGHGALQVPSLHGVAFRPPYMHDGRSPDLRAAVDEMLRVSTPGGVLTEAEQADMLAYLGSLDGVP